MPKDARPKYLSMARHLDPHHCGVAGLARLLFSQFTMGHRVMPDPSKDWAAWVKFSVFGTGQSGRPMSYRSMNESIKPQLRFYEIFISKVCHAFRAGGARFADAWG